MTITLAMHADRSGAPVDVVQPEPGDLAAPQAEPDQQSQDRQIAASNGGVGITGRKQTLDLIGLKPLGQPSQPSSGHFWHSRDKRAFRHTVQMQKAQERPQRRDRQLRHA